MSSRLRWPAVAAAAAFATSAVGTSLLHLSRPLFVAAWTAVVTMTIIAWVMSEGWNPMVQIRRRWVSGLVVGVMAGGALAVALTRSPGSVSSGGARTVVWLGVVYGAVDAIMLSIVPVLSLYGARPGDDLGHSSRIRMAGLALVASIIIAAAYDLGFAEFRSAALVKPGTLANLVVTMACVEREPARPHRGPRHPAHRRRAARQQQSEGRCRLTTERAFHPPPLRRTLPLDQTS